MDFARKKCQMVLLVKALCSLFIVYCIYFSVNSTIKAMGYKAYNDPEEEKNYKDWVEERGLQVTIVGFIVILLSVFGLTAILYY